MLNARRSSGRVLRCALALVVLFACLVPTAAHAGPGPTLSVRNDPQVRGTTTVLFGRDLTPDATYTLSAPYGYFGDSPAAAQTVATGNTGAFDVGYTMTGDVPNPVSTVALVATGPDGTHTVPVEVSEPYMGVFGGVCPGQAVEVYGEGFADGTYHVTSASATFSSAEYTAEDGILHVSAVYATHLTGDVDVVVTADDAAGTSFHFTWQAERPTIDAYPPGRSTFSRHVIGCFEPGETVTFSSTSPDVLTPRPTVVPASGSLTFLVNFLSGPDPTTRPGVVVTGTRSGRTVTSDPTPIFGTTLRAGTDLSGSIDRLVSPRPAFNVGVSECALVESEQDASGSREVWQSPDQPRYHDDACRARVGSTGNLVITRSNGRPVWSTRTQGTGSANYLVLQQRGRLWLYNRLGQPVWDNFHGIVRTPRALGGRQVLAGGEFLVNAAARFGLRHNGDIVLKHGRTVLWHSGTAHRGGTRLTFRQDASLLLTTARGRPVWRTNFNHQTNVTHLSLTGRGVVRITDTYGDLIWRR